MRRAALLALASLSVAADAPEVRLPEASAAKKPLEGAAVVTLTAQGLILVEKDGKPDAVSLEKLTAWLRDRAGTGALKPGERSAPTEMPVLIRADEKAPWLHVQRLLEACAQAGVTRSGFGVKGAGGEEGRLGPPAVPSFAWDEGSGARLAVGIAVTREEGAVSGPTQTPVTVPAEITYRMGATEAKDIDAVRRYLRDAGQTATEGGQAIRATIEPDAKVPFGVVVAVLNEYHRAGFEDVRFRFVGPEATPAERTASRLPYPSR